MEVAGGGEGVGRTSRRQGDVYCCGLSPRQCDGTTEPPINPHSRLIEARDDEYPIRSHRDVEGEGDNLPTCRRGEWDCLGDRYEKVWGRSPQP